MLAFITEWPREGSSWYRPQHAGSKPRGTRGAIPLSSSFQGGDPKTDCTRLLALPWFLYCLKAGGTFSFPRRNTTFNFEIALLTRICSEMHVQNDHASLIFLISWPLMKNQKISANYISWPLKHQTKAGVVRTKAVSNNFFVSWHVDVDTIL